VNRKPLRFAALLFVPLAGIAAAGARRDAPATQPSPAPVTITIDNFNFSPKSVTIAPGTTVSWVNRDDVPHTATGKGAQPAFDSKMLDTDQKFSFTFTTPGTYDYYCKVHPQMTGRIVVK
jgi:amicyanin